MPVDMTNALIGAPAFSNTPSHPFELTITSEVKSLDQLVQSFRFALWVEGHHQETDFLNYHYNITKSRSTFLDFLERVYKELSRYKDSEREIIRTIDFDTCSNKEKYNKNYSRDALQIKCSLLREFIDRKREQFEQNPSKKENNPSEVSQLLFEIFDGCCHLLFTGTYSSKRMKQILFDPLSNLNTSFKDSFEIGPKKGDLVFTLIIAANPVWVKLGPQKLTDFLLNNFRPDTGKYSVDYITKFRTPSSPKRIAQLETIREELMDLSNAGHEKDVTESIEKLLSLTKSV